MSAAFVGEVLAKFGPALAAARSVLRVDPDDFHSAFHHESREWLAGVNVADEVKRNPAPGVDPTALFARVDIGLGDVGYAEKMSVDLRHRLFSAFYYITDAAETAMVGGDLEFYESRPMDAVHVDDVYDRNPAVLSLTPRANTLVLFLSTADSLHGVSPITAQRSPHLAVRLAISGRAQLWNDCVPSIEECVVSASGSSSTRGASWRSQLRCGGGGGGVRRGMSPKISSIIRATCASAPGLHGFTHRRFAPGGHGDL